MARMDDDAQQPVGRCGTSIHPQEDRQDHVIYLTVKQAMASSNYATHSKQLQVKEWYNNDYPATQDDVVRIHERFAHIYFNANEGPQWRGKKTQNPTTITRKTSQ